MAAGDPKRSYWSLQKKLDMRLAEGQPLPATPFSERKAAEPRTGEHPVRSLVVSTAVVMAFVLTPACVGYSPARGQDFSITNQGTPVDAFHRDLMRQLQAWWDVHAYYPRHASSGDEAGTVVVHLRINTDGRIWTADLAGSSGSYSLNSAAVATFRNGFVQKFPDGEKDVDIDLRLHYVLTHKSDEEMPVSLTPPTPKRPFTITNDPIKSPILETMLLKTCTGEVVRGGVRNHPIFGSHGTATAIFFRRPDGTPWVSLDEGGYPNLSPVVEIGKRLQWTGREEHLGRGGSLWTSYEVWPDGDNHIVGNLIGAASSASVTKGDTYVADHDLSGTVDFTCETRTVPTPNFNTWFAQTTIKPSGDPP
jgi:TonB family protein